MAEIRVTAERDIAAPPQQVYGSIADYRQHRPQWLPPAFSNLQVEDAAEGTIVRYHLSVGSRERDYRMRVAEPEPGSALTESDTNSSLVTRWTVMPQGADSRVRVETTWQGAAGIGGFFERTFAPRALRNLYMDALSRLDQYVRGQASS